MFEQWDKDGNGSLSIEELMVAVPATFHCEVGAGTLRDIFRLHDRDGSGTIDFSEFTSLVSDIENLVEAHTRQASVDGAMFTCPINMM
jgi:Ca2+-binding EF-hand superfamily protein